MFFNFYSGNDFPRRLRALRIPICALLVLVFFVPEPANPQQADSGGFEATLDEARNLTRSAVWNNQYGESLRDGVNLATSAMNLAKTSWGEQDLRYLRAVSVYAVAMSQHTLGIISRSESDAVASVELVETMTTEAGSIARTKTRDGELVMMATLVKARLARISGDEEKAMQLYDFVVQALEKMMAADHPILVGVKKERG